MRGLSPVTASGGHSSSSSRCAGLSLSRPLLLRSTSSRRAGSVIVAHGPSCSAACGIFPDQGSNPCPLHWQADSQPLCHLGSPHGRGVFCTEAMGAHQSSSCSPRLLPRLSSWCGQGPESSQAGCSRTIAQPCKPGTSFVVNFLPCPFCPPRCAETCTWNPPVTHALLR